MEKLLLQRGAWITETKSNDATLPGGGGGGGGELDYDGSEWKRGGEGKKTKKKRERDTMVSPWLNDTATTEYRVRND